MYLFTTALLCVVGHLAHINHNARVQLAGIKALYEQRGQDIEAALNPTPRIQTLLELARANPLSSQQDLYDFDVIQETITTEIQAISMPPDAYARLQRTERAISYARSLYYLYASTNNYAFAQLPSFKAERALGEYLVKNMTP